MAVAAARVSGRPRSLRTATSAAIEAARSRIAPADEPLAVLAVKLSGQFDKAESTAEMVRLGTAVAQLLDALPLREPMAPLPVQTPGGVGGDNDDAAAPSGIDAELAGLVGSGPTMGH